jgi:hypothetical protein
MDHRMREVLQGFGYQPGPELDTIMAHIVNTSEAAMPSQAGQMIVDALRARDAGLRTEEQNYLGQAERSMNAWHTRWSNALAKSRRDQALSPDIVMTLERARAENSRFYKQAYDQLHQMADGKPVIDLEAAAQEAHEAFAGIDPQMLPKVVRDFVTREGSEPIMAAAKNPSKPMLATIEEAHNLRTALRAMSRTPDLSPIGQRIWTIKNLAATIDRQLNNSSAPAHVGEELRRVDAQYQRDINRFTEADMNRLVRDTRAGRPPNPEQVASMLVDRKSVASTRQVYEMLPPEQQARVQGAYLSDLWDAVTTRQNGQLTLNPQALMRELDDHDRQLVHEFMFGRNSREIGVLRRMAQNFGALRGDIQVDAIPRGTGTESEAIRENLQRGFAARRALEEEVNRDPRGALDSTNPQIIEHAAKHFLQSEARTEAAYTMFGNGPEWRQLQREAIVHFLKEAIEPTAGLGSTVSGQSIERALGGLTRRQQELLFPGPIGDDIRLLARQSRALFPEMTDEMGVGLAGANIMGNMTKRIGQDRMAKAFILGRLADNPYLIRTLAGSARSNPGMTAKIISYMAQAGANFYLPYELQHVRNQPSDFAPYMAGVRATRKQREEAEVKQRLQQYGGPQE